MELKDAIERRYSCRLYAPKKVDTETIRSIIDLARNAPSASNRQEWCFVAVTDPERIRAIAERVCEQPWVATAPVVLLCCADTDNHVMRCRQLCYPLDIAIIMDHVSLIATDRGLATCWLGAFSEDAARELCGVPRHVRVVELMAMGYPGDEPRQKTRVEVERILFSDHWERPL